MIERTGGHLSVTAPMVISTATALLEAGNALLTEKEETVDLQAVPEADSSALAVMLAWMRAAQAAGRQLHFANAPAAITALADLYGVDEILMPG
ncbi:MAG: lipid asymmetry maintenance protein MlaB [Betaproteobacteria bacterium]